VSAAGLRPLGFVLLMLGFGLRLDTEWQRVASVLLLAGALAAAMGLLGLVRDGRRSDTFVQPPGKR
jgi:hypothetical protein